MKITTTITNEEGYILPTVMMVGVLISTSLLGLTSYLITVNQIEMSKLNKTKLNIACYNSIQSIIASENYSDSNFFIFNEDSAEVSIRNKGLYKEAVVKAWDNRDSSKAVYMLGNKLSSYFRNALTLSKPNLRATVAGKTHINGDMLLTTDKVSMGRISGIKKTAKNYHKGNIVVDEELHSKIFNDSLLTKLFQSDNYDTDYEIIEENADFTNDAGKEFKQPGKYIIEGDFNISTEHTSKYTLEPYIFIVKGATTIETGTISNKNIEIYSDSLITIEKSSNLENILLCSSGEIKIEENSYFKNAQIFSKDKITITKAQFDYPSVLCLYNAPEDSASLNDYIEINESIINGSLLLISTTVGIGSNKTKIRIDNGSKIHGIIYCENNLESHGDISGSVYSYNTWFYKEPTEYINWLVNLQIDRKALDENLLIPVGFNSVSKHKILSERWIY